MLSPGQQLVMTDVTWQMYERILEEFGEKRSARINYSQGLLEIMVPLPEHEVSKVIIGDLIKALLEELNLEFWSLASTTFKNEAMQQGLEPDDCFYIEHEAAIRGKKRIDLTVDPPPDLAVEIDLTSRTRLDNYEKLGVKELWRFDGEVLEISVLQEWKYQRSHQSFHFPMLAIAEIIPQYLERSKVEGRNQTMKAFRAWVKAEIERS
ncbi:Flavodoxin reductases (ferredoxin-NADPH reductases) family 1 [Geitlerinema sp. FC II]|nr:Flavodoxin reductases (ferredoxin-NADPH reductases) family 1 [Geitlerinema sp. FC II]